MNTPRATDRVTIERTFSAAPELVYAAWTDPAILARWISPNPNLQVRVEGTAVEGGAYAVHMGAGYTVRGTWLTLRPFDLLELDWSWDREDHPPSHVRVELSAEPEGTRLALTHSRLADAQEAAGHGEGWTLSLTRLDDVFAETPPRA